MRAECSECYKIVTYYQLKNFQLVSRGANTITVLMKFVCMDFNTTQEYSRDEIVIRANALEVLRAPVADPRGVAEENKKNNLFLDGIHRS